MKHGHGTRMPALLAAMLLSVAGLPVMSGGAVAEWQARPGWGPFPPSYPYPNPYPRDAIAAGVAGGIAGTVAGSVINDALSQPQDQPYAPPSSVYIAPPRPADGSVPPPDHPAIAVGSRGPATLPPQWQPDCYHQVAPASGVIINGQPTGPACN